MRELELSSVQLNKTLSERDAKMRHLQEALRNLDHERDQLKEQLHSSSDRDGAMAELQIQQEKSIRQLKHLQVRATLLITCNS